MSSRAQRFWPKVRIGGQDECWEWAAARDKNGYGQFWNPNRRTMDLAHRVAYELANGPLPPKKRGEFGAVGVLVCHRCDNPPCVNPAHLFPGDAVANMRDCVAKGRNRPTQGQRNPRVRLTLDQVQKIRDSYSGIYGEKSAIARAYGISTSQVSKILLRQVWVT